MDNETFRLIVSRLRRGVECADEAELVQMSAPLALQLIDFAVDKRNHGWQDEVKRLVREAIDEYEMEAELDEGDGVEFEEYECDCDDKIARLFNLVANMSVEIADIRAILSNGDRKSR